MILEIDETKCKKCGTCTSILWALPDAGYLGFRLTELNAKNVFIMNKITKAVRACPEELIIVK